MHYMWALFPPLRCILINSPSNFQSISKGETENRRIRKFWKNWVGENKNFQEKSFSHHSSWFTQQTSDVLLTANY
ncbi:hypothetical protein IC582_000959 [Cucumis melo]